MQRFKALLPQTRTSLRTLYSYRRAFSAQPNYAEHDDDDSQEQVTLLTFLVCAFSVFFSLLFCLSICDVVAWLQILVEGRAKSRAAILNRPSSLNSLNASMVRRRFFLFLSVFWVRSSQVKAESFAFRRLVDWRGCMIRGKRTLTLDLFWWRYHCCFHGTKLPMN